MAKPLTLTIVIPAYNEEAYLKSCLQAISRQTIQPDEVIVVDNNSSDKTVAIAKQFPFVRLLSEKRQGLYYSRQTGMDAAKSDVIARIDADTFVEPGWVAAIKHAFQDPTVSSASGPAGYHDWAIPQVALKVEDVLLRIARLGRYHFLAGANMAIRRSAWNLVKDELCNEPFLFEDIDIATHLKAHGLLPSYVPAMKVLLSARRFADNPRDFTRYIKGHVRTLDYHDQKSVGAYYAVATWGLIYFAGGKPLYEAFDPAERRFSLSHLLQKTEARPDPMAAK